MLGWFSLQCRYFMDCGGKPDHARFAGPLQIAEATLSCHNFSHISAQKKYVTEEMDHGQLVCNHVCMLRRCCCKAADGSRHDQSGKGLLAGEAAGHASFCSFTFLKPCRDCAGFFAQNEEHWPITSLKSRPYDILHLPALQAGGLAGGLSDSSQSILPNNDVILH